jgi:neutral ceramidase
VDKLSFKAGAAQVDITPPLGTIIGVDMLPHYTRFIHDHLHSKAVVLKKGNLTVAIVVVDICIMATDYMDDIKKRIQRKTGIPPQYIVLSSNHNHASGDVVGLLGGAVDIAYHKKLPDLIVQSVVLAKKKLKNAKIAYGSVDAPEFVVCRRYLMQEGFEAKNPVTRGLDIVKTNPLGAEKQIVGRAAEPDPEVYFLVIKDHKNKWISVLANYSLHYAADWPDDSITADFFGVFAAKIKGKLSEMGENTEGVIGIMSNGTSGDINIWDFIDLDRLPKEHYAKSALIGSTLAQRVIEKIPDLTWDNDPDLAIAYENIDLALRKPSAEELAVASKHFIDNDFNDLGTKKDFIQRIYDREQVLLSQYPDTTTLPVQAVKVGDLVMGALPGEFFAETGLLLKKAIKRPYFSLALCNAYGGYIPPAHEMDRGGYETWRARSSCMERGAEEKIRTKMVALANSF